jgi:uncharacterized protein
VDDAWWLTLREALAPLVATYYDFREPVRDIPSHRFLAIRRGEAEGVLRASVEVDPSRLLPRMAGLAKDRGAR